MPAGSSEKGASLVHLGRFSRWFAALVVGAVVLAGCGGGESEEQPRGEEGASGDPRHGGTLSIPLAQEPTTLDLMQEPNALVQQVVAQMYDPLLRLDPELLPEERELVPWLATDWEQNDDATEIELTLREGVTFHDGEPFTAEDVKATLERARDVPEGTTSYQASVLEGVTVEVTGDHSVVLRSEAPNPMLLPSLATPAFVIVPAHVVVDDPEGLEEEPVGTGPFRLAAWDRGSSITLERNDDYWNDPYPYLDGIEYVLMPDLNARTSGFISGSVQLSGQGVVVPAPEWEVLAEQVPGTTLYEHGSGSVFQTFFNTEVAPFDDPRVRRAFAMVADQQVQGDRAHDGYTVLNTYGSAVGLDFALPDDELAEHPGVDGVDDDVRERARGLLAEAGHPDGLEVEYLVGDVPVYVALAEVYASQLEQIGVTAKLRILPLDTDVTPAVREGNFQMAQTAAGANFYDPCLTLTPYTTGAIGSVNYSRYSNPQVDALVEEICSSPDTEARRDAAFEVQRILWEDAPSALSANTTYVQGARPEVKGVTSPGLLRENLWLETVWLND